MRNEIKQLERSLRLYAGGAEHLLLEPLDPDLLQALQAVQGLNPLQPQLQNTDLRPSHSAPQGRLAPATSEPPPLQAREPQPPLPPELEPDPQAETPADLEPAMDARQAGSLDALHVRFLGCMNCGLGPLRKNLVFGEGNPKAKLVFVGEGPGEEEDRQGRPFVGRAGQLLTQMICSLGVSRESVYICNVVKCRPPGNRNPEAPEVAACRPILQRQLELLAPKVIVALGNVALQWLVPHAAGIKRMRGTIQQYQGIKVIPTFHPSYLLRSPSDLALAWRDMKLIRQEFFMK